MTTKREIHVRAHPDHIVEWRRSATAAGLSLNAWAGLACDQLATQPDRRERIRGFAALAQAEFREGRIFRMDEPAPRPGLDQAFFAGVVPDVVRLLDADGWHISVEYAPAGLGQNVMLGRWRLSGTRRGD